MILPPLVSLSAEDIRRALPMAEAVAAMKDAFVALSAGKAGFPGRTNLPLEGDALALVMPCVGTELGAASLKWLGFCPSNSRRGLPVIHALVILADATSGAPLGILEGSALTALRTGAASGAATHILARSEASTAAIFGAGTQARAQLEAVGTVRRLVRARIFDVDSAAASAFAAEMTARLGIEVSASSSPSEALAGADIVCTATTAVEPVFDDRDIRPGTHINAVGVFDPRYAEIPPETVVRARVIVDQVAASLEEAGDLLRPLAAGRIVRGHFETELGAVLSGRAEGRRSPDEITLFKSVGLAVQDLYAAARAVSNARRLGLGTPLPR
jgi:ornithine cyclodeaminase/alanine dehydrogenase-like protein (mu-crystallin family)